MAHIPEQLIKINKNIQEAESILSDLKNRTKTENVAEQIEHFESMLNKLNNLRESYIQLSAQYEAANDTKIKLPVNNQNRFDDHSEVATSCENVFSAVDQLEQLKQERDRLKKELQERQLDNYGNQLTNSLEVDITNNSRPFSPQNSFSDLVSDLHNFTGLDLSFYISVLDHHIEIGTKMVDMVDGLNLSDNLTQGICLLKEVIQRLIELRERFQCVQNTKETIESQSGIDDDLLQREMETFNSISEDLKGNFSTGVKCFKSAMDIIQSYLDPESVQVNDIGLEDSEEPTDFSHKLNESSCTGSTLVEGDETMISRVKNNNNNSESASEDNNNRSNEDDNNDGGDEDSDDSCREKDQDESMEIGVGIVPTVDGVSDHTDQQAMHHLRLQTEFEQKEILRLLEEKRVMLKKLADLKRAKDIAKNQVLGLAHSGDMFGDFSRFLSLSQCNDMDDEDNEEDGLSNSPRSDPLTLRPGNITSEIGSLLKMFSDMKTEVSCDESHQGNSPRMSASNDTGNNVSRQPFNCNALTSYSTQSGNLMPELNEKAEELKQKQSQIQQLQEMLAQIKSDSISLNESIIRDSNDGYQSDGNNEPEITSNGRPGKGRDSVTFQEPVATFIANEELYENMREVRMRREELRDRNVRNSNSDPRSPSGRVMDSGNAPGAPPDAPVRMPVSSHETASQDRTTVATWGSSSAGGDDYDEHNGHHNQLNSENLRIRSAGSGRPPSMAIGTDERSRVAPIGQSSTFRSKPYKGHTPPQPPPSTQCQQQLQQQQSHQLHPPASGPQTDLSSLKGQIETIASLCRNMAMEQSRLARDMADLKSGSSPRQPSAGPDLVMHHSPWTAITSSGSSKAPPPPPPIVDECLGHWSVSGGNGGSHTAVRTTDQSGHQHMEPGWDESSLATSSVVHQQQQQQQLLQRPMPTSYYYQAGAGASGGYQNHLMQQHNMLLHNHSIFIKLQMSMIASQLEQQRLCAMALQQQQQPPALPHGGIYPGPMATGWPGYPPLTQPTLNMMSATGTDPSLLLGCMPPGNFMDMDCGIYGPMYPATDTRGDTPSTINHHNTMPVNGNPWKNTFASGRNIHRN